MRFLNLYIILFITTVVATNSMAQEDWTKTDKATAIYESWSYHNIQFNYDSAMYYGDEFMKYQLEHGSKSEIINAYHHKIKSLNRFNKFDIGFRLAHETFSKYCGDTKELENCASCNDIYSALADYMVTLQNYRQGIKYLQMRCYDDGGDAMDYYAKAHLLFLLELPDSALISTSTAIDLAKNQTDPLVLIRSYNQHGLIAKSLGRFDEAITSFSTALKIIDSADISRSSFGFIIGNLGSCYYEIGELNLAYSYLLEDSERSLKNKDFESYINTQLLLAKIDLLENNHQAAIVTLNNLLDNYGDQILIRLKLEATELLMQAYEGVGNKSKFNYYLKEWIALNKSHFRNQAEVHKKMNEESTANSLRQVTKQMDIEKELLDQKLLAQQREKDKDQLKSWLLLSGLLIAFLFIFFLFWRARKRAHLRETQLKLVQKEQDFLKLKVKEEAGNVQVLSHELMVKQDFSTRLVQQLNQLTNIAKPELRNLELFIQNELDVKSTRAELQEIMGELSSDFYSMLKIKHPTLTQADVALAAMIAMKMTNKEIGISKNMSSESVKTTKYRLKKKLNLSTSEDMSSYLKDLIHS